MSRKEAPRAGLFKAAVAGQISNAQAARALQPSERQVQRLKARYRVEGAAGLPHRSRGRPSTRGLPAALTQQVRALLQTTYRDVNDCHAPGKLREVDGLRVSQGAAFSKDGGSGHGPTAAPRRGTAGQASPPAGAVPRARRTPEARMGALVQLDASLFDWLEHRGPRVTLHGAIDDATTSGLSRPYTPFQSRSHGGGHADEPPTAPTLLSTTDLYHERWRPHRLMTSATISGHDVPPDREVR